jgi:hypothetical protein
MIVLTPGDATLWKSPAAVGALASFCAELLRARPTAGCLASLPEEDGARRRLFTFMRSLQQAGGGRCAVMISSPRVTYETLLECELAGITRLVIVQGSQPPAAAIDEVARHRDSRPRSNLDIHVWVDAGCPGNTHSTSLAWMHRFGSSFPVEVTPIAFASHARLEPDVPGGLTPAGHKRPATTSDAVNPVACEWLRSMVTIDPSGGLVPCPHHAPRAELSLDRNPAELRLALTAFPQSLSGDPTCRGCTRRMRFTLPEWLRSAPSRDVAGASVDTATTASIDHVGRRLDEVEPTERRQILDTFIERVRSHGAR